MMMIICDDPGIRCVVDGFYGMNGDAWYEGWKAVDDDHAWHEGEARNMGVMVINLLNQKQVVTKNFTR